MQKLKLIHIYRAILFLDSLVLVCVFWGNPIFLFICLSLLFLEMNRTLKWRVLKTSLLIAVLGPLAEVLVVITSDAWRYQVPQLLDIPLWLAPLWGMAGLFFMALASFIGEGVERD